MKFPSELKDIKYKAEEKALFHGLTFPKVIFEYVDMDQLHEAAAFVGMPVNIQHFLYGQEFENLTNKFKHGLARIYEMVINHDPSYAYLLDSNTLADQKLVIAHVYAHVDFFHNNNYFKRSDKKMVRWMANKAIEIESMKEKHGLEKVEDFITDIFKIGRLVDPIPHKKKRKDPHKKRKKKIPGRIVSTGGFKPYMDSFLNPEEAIREKEKAIKEEENEEHLVDIKIRIPEKPTRDVLGFLAKNAPLEDWQREIIWFFRKWFLYIFPQIQTKFMNEGWAAYWHNFLANNMGLIDSSELSTFAIHNAGTLGSPGFNPYKTGKAIWEDIEYRWDTGRHGPLYEECESTEIVDRWDEYAVFEHLHRIHEGNSEKIEADWQAVHLLEKCIIDNKVEFPPEAYSRQKFVNFSYYYLNTDEYNERYEALYAEANQRRQAAENNEQRIRADAVKEDTNWYLRFHRMIQAARKEIEKGKFKPIVVPIPTSFWEYARETEDTPLNIMKGREKMFQVREEYEDMGFFREFLTPELITKLKLFSFKPDEEYERWVIDSKDADKIKAKLERKMANSGAPMIVIKDANYENKKELYLVHNWDYFDLDREKASLNLEAILKIWQNPVHLEFVETEEEDEEKDDFSSMLASLGIRPTVREKEEKKGPEMLKIVRSVLTFFKTDDGKIGYDVKDIEKTKVPKIF